MSVKLQGMADVLRALKSMGKDVDSRKIESLTNKESQNIVMVARSYMPEQSGEAKNAVRVLSTRTEKGHTGTLAGIDWDAEHGYIAHILEFGTAPRFTKDGKYTGEIRPYGFMRRAFDSNKQGAAERLNNGVLKIIVDLAKKNNIKIK